MTIELPDGLSARLAGPSDADALFELITTCETFDDGDFETDPGDIQVAFSRPGFDPPADTVLVLDGEELVAYAELYHGRAEAHVRPSHRARGIGTALVRWIEARARAVGAPAVGHTKTDADAAARALFLAHGFRADWTSWIIRRPLDAAPPLPDVPPGISTRPYRPSDARDVHRVVDAAFSEWPGREPEPFDVWASQVLSHPSLAEELSPLAFDGGDLVGVVISYDFPEYDEGWIMQLATKATHRRRGIAQALLLTAFGWFFERGRHGVGVSTDSRTGALALYEKVGMQAVRQYTRYTKRLG